MDMDKAVKVLEEMKQKLMLLRDVSDQFGESALSMDYGRQVKALDIVLGSVKEK